MLGVIPINAHVACVYRCVEDGTAESSGLKELFDQNVQHITDDYKTFFQHWYRLACLEVRHCRHDSKEALWAQDIRNQYATIVFLLFGTDHVMPGGSMDFA